MSIHNSSSETFTFVWKMHFSAISCWGTKLFHISRWISEFVQTDVIFFSLCNAYANIESWTEFFFRFSKNANYLHQTCNHANDHAVDQLRQSIQEERKIMMKIPCQDSQTAWLTKRGAVLRIRFRLIDRGQLSIWSEFHQLTIIDLI